MPDEQILRLNAPSSTPIEARGPTGRSFVPPGILGRDIQATRLTPKFDRLERALAGAFRLADDAAGYAPEKVLVIETRGEPRDFVAAAERLGFEFLGDIDDHVIDLDEDEVNEYERIERDVYRKGHLYLTATDSRALAELVRVWRRYDRREPIPGELSGLKNLFLHVHELRFWGPADRIFGTGLEELFDEARAHGENDVQVEIELWYRSDEEQQERAVTELEESLPDGVEVLRQYRHDAIRYHGALISASVPERPLEAQWLQSDAVMRARPAMQLCTTPREELGEEPAADEEIVAAENRPLPTGEPVVALLDGLPVANHPALAGRVLVDDPLDWSPLINVIDRRHGTSMASAIIHGDLSSRTDRAIQSTLYARPVLKPNGWVEAMPTDELAVKLLDDALGRALSECPTLRIVNLSIGDPRADVMNLPGPIARLLDFYSTVHGLVFVVSAGNRSGPIELDRFASIEDVRTAAVGDREAATLAHLVNTAGGRRIMPPAESPTALTVGAASADECDFEELPGGHLELVAAGSPATYSAHGPGIRRQIKPEILAPGGRGVHSATRRGFMGEATELQVFAGAEGVRSAPPGVLTARAPTATTLASPFGYVIGTSVAAALVSHGLAQLLEVMEARIEDGAALLRDRTLTAAMLRCLAVHSAAHGEWYDVLARARGNPASYADVAAASGYGVLYPSRLLEDPGPNVVTLVYAGIARTGHSERFTVPIPPAISGIRARRTATITTASYPPIDPARAAYALGGVFGRIDDNSLSAYGLSGKHRCNSHATKRGTVTQMCWKGVQAITVEEGEALEVVVDCFPRSRADAFQYDVPYALAVTLTLDSPIRLRDEVRTRLRERVAERVRAQI